MRIIIPNRQYTRLRELKKNHNNRYRENKIFHYTVFISYFTNGQKSILPLNVCCGPNKNINIAIRKNPW